MELVASHKNIVEKIMEELQRMNDVLGKEPDLKKIPTEITTLRVNLEAINSYKELLNEKMKLIE